jgi:segregation and condensation protein A
VTDPRHDPLEEDGAARWEEEPWAVAPQAPLPEQAADAPPVDEAPRDAYRVTLPAFEGPLDLLLHLIRVNQINIYDIPIAEVARQYGRYLDLMRDLNLEVAADYLVMAATLVYIKSKLILPSPPDSEEPQEDPRAELRDRLLEYQRFKQAARALAERDEEARRVWGVGAPPPEAIRGEALVEATLFDLLNAFQRVLQSIGEDARLEFRRDTLRVADSIARILELLELSPMLLFEELLSRLESRAERIVIFLALLEMIRLQVVRAVQARGSGRILLMRRTPLLLAAADGSGR